MSQQRYQVLGKHHRWAVGYMMHKVKTQNSPYNQSCSGPAVPSLVADPADPADPSDSLSDIKIRKGKRKRMGEGSLRSRSLFFIHRSVIMSHSARYQRLCSKVWL